MIDIQGFQQLVGAVGERQADDSRRDVMTATSQQLGPV